MTRREALTGLRTLMERRVDPVLQTLSLRPQEMPLEVRVMRPPATEMPAHR